MGCSHLRILGIQTFFFFHTRITSLGLTVRQKRLAAWFAQTISGNFRGYFRDVVDVLTPLA